MKAWTVTAGGRPADVMELVERDSPSPGEGELRVRVLAAGVSLPEVLMCRDDYAYKPERPFTPGHEVVGVGAAILFDVELGEGVLRAGLADARGGVGGGRRDGLEQQRISLAGHDRIPHRPCSVGITALEIVTREAFVPRDHQRLRLDEAAVLGDHVVLTPCFAFLYGCGKGHSSTG